MIKYKLEYGGSILKVQIEKETSHFVFWKRYEQGRLRKESKDTFFDTFDAAKESVIKKAEREVEGSKSRLEYALRNLEEAKALTE